MTSLTFANIQPFSQLLPHFFFFTGVTTIERERERVVNGQMKIWQNSSLDLTLKYEFDQLTMNTSPKQQFSNHSLAIVTCTEHIHPHTEKCWISQHVEALWHYLRVKQVWRAVPFSLAFPKPKTHEQRCQLGGILDRFSRFSDGHSNFLSKKQLVTNLVSYSDHGKGEM